MSPNGAHRSRPCSQRMAVPITVTGSFYRVVVLTLALVAVGALGASIYLAASDQDIPQSIVALGSTAVGALAGVLMTGKG